jgi:hypothetical protein
MECLCATFFITNSCSNLNETTSVRNAELAVVEGSAVSHDKIESAEEL